MRYLSVWGAALRQLTFSRGLRLVIFAACVTAFLVLSSISLDKFVRADVVKSFEVDEAARQTFAVTICRIQPEIFKPDAYRAVIGSQLPDDVLEPTSALTRQFPWDAVGLEQALWNITYSWDDLVVACTNFYNSPCAPSDVSSALYQYGGQCHTVTYDDAMAEGVQKGLWMVLRHQRCRGCRRHHWDIYVHASKDRYMDWEHVWAPPRAQLEAGKEQVLKVKRMLEVSLPTSERPCVMDPAYSQPNCIRACLFEALARLGPGCRLPWMPVDLPVCSSATDYQALYNYTRMLSRTHIVWAYTSRQLRANKYYAALKRIEGTCKARCEASCYKESITLSLADRLNDVKNGTWVGLRISEGLYVSRQAVAYDTQQMISDIGGNLGLLLGASAFTLYELLESCARRCWRQHGGGCRPGGRGPKVKIDPASAAAGHGRAKVVAGGQEPAPVHGGQARISV